MVPINDLFNSGALSRTGQFGAAVSTSSIAVGARVAHVRARVGGTLTQYRTDPRLGQRGLDLLQSGCRADEALSALVASCEFSEWRQLAVIDATGRTAGFTGAKVKPHLGEIAVENCVVVGNILASERVLPDMASAFERSSDASLAERLMQALEAAVAAGGEGRPGTIGRVDRICRPAICARQLAYRLGRQRGRRSARTLDRIPAADRGLRRASCVARANRMTRTNAAPLWKDAFEAAAATVSSSRAIIKDFQTICGFGGRFAGTDSERRARRYLASRLAEVSGARVEEYPVPYKGWDRGPASVTIVGGPRFAATGLGRSPSTNPAGLRAPLIDLGRGTPDDFGRAGKKLSGGIALVRHEYMLALDHIHRRKKYAMAKAAGAAGFLIASGLPGEILVTGSAGSLEPDDIPGAGISMESAKALTDRGGEVDVRVQGHFHDRTAINLVTEIPGRTAELVVLTAHIDGHDLAASAIDNASGLACVLAIAAALRPVVPRLRRGLMIALFNVEEWAVLGSRHFLETLPESRRRLLSFNVNLDFSCRVAGSSR